MEELEQGLFDDVDMPVEDVEEAEPTEVETEVEPEVPVEPFLKIKYDKEEIGLTQEEAKELAEKGKNYDRLRDRYNSLNDPIEKLARMYDMDVPTFINSLNVILSPKLCVSINLLGSSLLISLYVKVSFKSTSFKLALVYKYNPSNIFIVLAA